MLNLLFLKKSDHDPRLAKFPQQLEGRKIIYPRLPLRLIALLIDMLLIIILVLPFFSIVDKILPQNPKLQLFNQKLIEYQQKYPNDPQTLYQELRKDPEIIKYQASESSWQFLIGQIIPFVILFGILILYVKVCYRKFGNTIGKKILGLQILDAKTYHKIDEKRYIKRCFAYILTIMTLLIGYLIAHFNIRHITLHDYLANTVVIKLGKKL